MRRTSVCPAPAAPGRDLSASSADGPARRFPFARTLPSAGPSPCGRVVPPADRVGPLAVLCGLVLLALLSEAVAPAASSFFALAGLPVIVSGEAQAQDRQLRLTVYNNDLALVNDRRTLDVPAGGVVELADVPAMIDPTTVHLKVLRGDARVLEQNFQYDLADADRVLQRYLGQSIEAVLKDGGDIRTGTLLSYDGGSLVLRTSSGAVSVLARPEVIDLRLPKLPEGLRTHPTLVWRMSGGGGQTPAELSYLTGGVNWHAEYVAVSNEQDTSIDLSAWVSLANNSGASYPEAKLQLIAGDVQRVQPPRPPAYPAAKGMRETAGLQAVPDFAEETFFEYHLYTLERPTTIADRETKQVALFPTATSPVKKIYEYDGQRDAKKVRVILEAENREDRGLGMPLPAGTVRVYKKDSRGDLQFVGEDRIDHTPRNERIRLGVGKAFDIAAERNVLSTERLSDHVTEQSIEVKIRNRKEERIEVVVLDHTWGDWEVRQASLPSKKKDATTVEFRVTVEPDAEAVLTYTLRQRH